MTIDLDQYTKFVQTVTSETSTDLTTFMNRLDELDGNYIGDGKHGPSINVSLLLTAAIGMAAETGEFCEIPKKMFFQGKELNADAVYRMKRELGDVIFYWINACLALELNPNDVIAENIHKLESRYPGGKFTVEHSENRKAGDV
jgi:NTP pyrophosphatase (non-canonical NTP hydrolase)